jgi:NTP-dependent ternary system trypsin peptidase co-occuring protein
MKHLVEFPLEDGSHVVIELDEQETAGTVRAGRGNKIEEAKETLEEALNKVLPATKSVLDKLRSMGNRPDEMEITFGINLSTVAGAIIASASVGANFGITLRWKEASTAPSA